MAAESEPMGDNLDIVGAVDEDIMVLGPASRPIPRDDIEYESDESKTEPLEEPFEPPKRHRPDS